MLVLRTYVISSGSSHGVSLYSISVTGPFSDDLVIDSLSSDGEFATMDMPSLIGNHQDEGLSYGAGPKEGKHRILTHLLCNRY